MTKLLSSLGLTLLLAFTVTGCELYFGPTGDDGPNGGGGGSGGGFSCTQDSDCAAGCYCNNGTCEEAGFCSDTQQCPEGFHCDDRSSCVPDACGADSDCLAGQVCTNGTCTTTCVCSNDREAVQGGFGYCDEARSTCMPGTDPAGSCVGMLTCTTAAPACAAGEVPLILDGCYTGACRAIAQCDAAPACPALAHEADCLARTADCTPVYTGNNCRDPNGAACTSGSANCTCESFTFRTCDTRNASRAVSTVVNGNGDLLYNNY